MSENIIHVPIQPLVELCARIFMTEGVREADARVVAASLVETDLRGTASHGVSRLENYMKRLQQGGITPDAECHILRETPTSVYVHAENSFGQVAAHYTAELVRKKAAESGVCVGVVRGSNHFGTSTNWAFEMCGNDMISLCFSNAGKNMVGPGTKVPAIGTNPFCISVPSEKYGYVCLDISCSTVAFGKVLSYRHENKPLPEGWFVDKEGRPTTDPFAALYTMPFGAHKGYGIAFMVEMLTSMLSGGLYGAAIPRQVTDLGKPNDVSHFLLAFRIDMFMDPAEYRARVDDYIAFIKSLPLRDDVPEIYFPGEIEMRKAEANRALGAPIQAGVAEEIIGYARAGGLAEEEYAFLSELLTDGNV